ncbi:MAG: pyridoxamine 5'-phosphate oxidase family protein, partial [Chitinophagaceae bacterium]|nr:pyridoxamine 5'-phosphate oxidase family protein [Chitinophagaceae bacterium]
MLGELNDKQIDSLLNTQLVGRLGCHAGGITYVVPVTYIYDNGDII